MSGPFVTRSEIRDFAKRLIGLESEVKARKQPQLAHSSIEDGALRAYVDDQITMAMGRQFDGTNVAAPLTGPTPAAPTAPTVDTAPETATVRWDGLLAGADETGVLPMDFLRVDVHVTDATVEPSIGVPPEGSITSARGGGLVISRPPGDYKAALVTRTAPGKASALSAVVTFTVPPLAVETGPTEPPEAVQGLAVAPFAIRAVRGSWAAQDGAEWYDVWADTDSTVDTDAAHYVGRVTANTILVDEVNDLPLDLAPYWLHVVPGNSIGAGPGTTSAMSALPRLAGNTEISSDYAYLGLVEARQIKSGMVESDLIVGAEIATSSVGTARSGISAMRGLFVDGLDATGNVYSLLTFPTDGTTAKVEADLVARTLTILDQLAVRGTQNEFSRGSVTTLSNGTTPPQSPPTAQVNYDGIALADPLDVSAARNGIVRYNGRWWSTQTYYGPNAGKVECWNAAGELDGVNSFSTGLNNHAGLTVVGDQFYVLGKDANRNEQWCIYRYSATGTKLGERVLGTSGPSGGVRRQPTIGTDGSRVLVAYSQTDGSMRVLHYSTDLTTFTDIYLSPAGGGNLGSRDVYGIGLGSFDFGVQRYVMAEADGVYQYAADTGQTVVGGFWPTATRGTRGHVWDATASRFVSISTNSERLDYYTSLMWYTESDRWYVSTTWRDSDTGGTGLHETSQSARTTVSMRKRARLTVTSGSPLPTRSNPFTADDVVAVGFYVGRGATDPGRAAMSRLAWPANGVISYTLDGPVAFNGSNPPPVAPGDFPVSSPAVIKSFAGGLYMDGSGVFAAPLAFQAGIGQTPTLAAGASANMTITFPYAFKTAPIVPAPIVRGTTQIIVALASTPTTTTVLFGFRNMGTTTIAPLDFHWTAFAPTS